MSKDEVIVYDSLYLKPIGAVQEQIASLLRTPGRSFKIRYAWCPKQDDGSSCGVHAIANLAYIILEKNAQILIGNGIKIK